MKPGKSFNERSGVDAGRSLCLHLLGCWPGASHRERWHPRKPMRTSHFTATAGLLAALLIGCSKPPSQSSPAAPSKAKSLGTVELTPGTPRSFSLGDRMGCIVTGVKRSDDIELKLVLLTTNADGAVQHSEEQTSTWPGQRCAVAVGETWVELTPTWKRP